MSAMSAISANFTMPERPALLATTSTIRAHAVARLARLAASAVLLLAAPAALGQDALGAGNVLDGNLNIQGRTNQRAPRIQDTINAANAIVTGNAAGGASFRGQLDYTASGDFRADLGEDALYSFRRDSYFSGLAGQGIRGTEAIQFQSALLTSATPSVGLLRNLVLDRPFSNTQQTNLFPSSRTDTSVDLLNNTGGLPDFDANQTSNERRSMLDESGAALWSLRSASAYSSMSPLNPALVATLDNNDGRRVGITSSTLRGLRAEVLGEQRINTAVNTRDATRSDAFQLPPQNTDAMTGDPATPASQMPPRSDQAGSYLDLLGRLQRAGEARDTETQPTNPSTNTNTGTSPSTSPTTTPSTTPSTTNPPVTATQPAANASARPDQRPEWQRSIVELRQAMSQSFGNRWSDGDRLRTPEERARVKPATIDLLQRARGRTESFRVPTDNDSLYAGHLATAELLLNDRRYFDAEHRFTRALAVRPNNGMAQIGRIHAQMGATMAWSASNNLRTLLRDQPELIAERYGPNLLPDPVHLKDLTDVLYAQLGDWGTRGTGTDAGADRDNRAATNANNNRAPNTSEQRARALLLAYIGYQYQRPAELSRGLNAMDALARDAIASGDPSAEGDLMLTNLVRTVWTLNGD